MPEQERPSCKVFAIRHGQTGWNAQQRVQGRTDIPLNDNGREQAHRAAGLLPSDIGIIFTSPLQRATETAEIINERFNVGIVADTRLMERNFGVYEGKYIADLSIESLRRWSDNAPTPGGETIRDVTKRVFDFMDDARKTFETTPAVLIVAHGHIVRPIFWYFNGLPSPGEESDIDVDTCSIFPFQYKRP